MTRISVQKRVYDIDAARLSYLTRMLHMSSQEILAPYIRTLFGMIVDQPDEMNIGAAKLYIQKMASDEDNNKLPVA